MGPPKEEIEFWQEFYAFVDCLPKVWRELSKEFPGEDDFMKVYMQGYSPEDARRVLQETCNAWTRQEWPKTYRDLNLKPFYDPRIKEPYK